jgi:preprotein translocase subunit SecA
MLDFISKLFGSKSERDVKAIQPIVEKIKAEFAKLDNISNDELRAKTIDFKETIAQGLSGIDGEIQAIKDRTENELDMDVSEKVELYTQLDKLEKDRNKELEDILLNILPEAFAVVKPLKLPPPSLTVNLPRARATWLLRAIRLYTTIPGLPPVMR